MHRNRINKYFFVRSAFYIAWKTSIINNIRFQMVETNKHTIQTLRDASISLQIFYIG